MDAHKIGEGWFTWPAPERRSDRYGQVMLMDTSWADVEGESGHREQVVIDTSIPPETYGKLVVKVIETYESQHIGDLFRGISPTTPAPGEEIVLGEGYLFYDNMIGLRPKDGREVDWLDIEALYKAIDQKVELFFLEIPIVEA